MKRFKANIIIAILMVILGLLIANIINGLRDKEPEVQQAIAYAKETEDLNESEAMKLESEIKKIDKMLILEGSCSTEVTYSDKEINENTNENFKWIKDKFREWRSRELTIKATYNFGFSYDMDFITIHDNGQELEITVSRNYLQLEYMELINTDSLYTESIGLLSKGDFTPQEISVLQERMKVKTANTIKSKSEYREAAMENLVNNITKLCKQLNIEAKINMNSELIDVTEKNEAKIENIKGE